jgi:hypothetical protein
MIPDRMSGTFCVTILNISWDNFEVRVISFLNKIKKYIIDCKMVKGAITLHHASHFSSRFSENFFFLPL